MAEMRDTLRTDSGAPIPDNQNSLTAGPHGPLLVQDYQLLEKHAHVNRERIPERVVYAKASAAFGTPTLGAAAFAGMLMTGCAYAPSINMLGAYFPDWLLCITAGVLLTIVFHLIRERSHKGGWLEPPAVVYPALVTLLALVVWLIFYQH